MRSIVPILLLSTSIVTPLSAGPEGTDDTKPREKKRLEIGILGTSPEQSSSKYPPPTIAQFRAHCVDCHDPDGRGEGGRELFKSVPDFTDLRWQGSRADEDLRRSILEGKGRSMPAMRAKIKPDDASRLVSLVRGFGGGRLVIPDQSEGDGASSRAKVPPTDKVPGPEASPSRVAPIEGGSPRPPGERRQTDRMFEQSCRKCHGADGKGDPLRAALPSIPDFTNRQWQQNTSRAQLHGEHSRRQEHAYARISFQARDRASRRSRGLRPNGTRPFATKMRSGTSPRISRGALAEHRRNSVNCVIYRELSPRPRRN